MTAKERWVKLIPDSRKLQLSYVSLLALCLLAGFGKVTGDALIWGIVGICTAFVGGNYGEHMSRKDKPEAPADK